MVWKYLVRFERDNLVQDPQSHATTATEYYQQPDLK